MLKALRWPLLVGAGGRMGLALLTQASSITANGAPQPSETPNPPTPQPTPSPAPTVEATPIPPLVMQSAPEAILVEALVGEIRKLNPLLAYYNPVDRDITSLIFEGLTTTDQYGEIVPDLAASWSISNDGLTYIVVLRQDVLWQDGIPFTAEDVTFTMKLMSDPAFPGASELHEFWRTVEVEALSDTMVRFRLTQPLASFLDQLRIGIVPAHVLTGYPVGQLGSHPFNLSPIGTGPYQIETLTASEGRIDGIQLRVAPVYRQRPEGAEGFALDRIIFRTYPTLQDALDAYQRGEVNSISTIPQAAQTIAQQLPNLSLYTAFEPHVGVLIYNWKRDTVSFVRNQRVRLALAHAVDIPALVNKNLAGWAIPADSPLVPNSWAYVPGLDRPAYDLARAQELMNTANLEFEASATEEPTPAATTEATEEPAPATTEEAPVQATAEATAEVTEVAPASLSMTILTLDDPALVALANEIASGWQQIGFTMTVEAVDAATLQTRLEAGDFDAAIVELGFEPSADPDPYVFWHQGQYQTGQNFGGMDDRRVSEALEMARRDPYGINRVVHSRRFQELFLERAPALVLYYPLYTYAVDARIQGIQLGFLSSTADRFRTIQDWSFAGS